MSARPREIGATRVGRSRPRDGAGAGVRAKRRPARTALRPALAAALLVLILSVGLTACAGTYTTISPEEVGQRLASDEPTYLLDVRTPGEYDAGHIPGAVLIPVQELESRLAEVPTDKSVVVYCLTASRSAEAAGILAAAGYGDVYNMARGIQAWTGPIER